MINRPLYSRRAHSMAKLEGSRTGPSEVSGVPTGEYESLVADVSLLGVEGRVCLEAEIELLIGDKARSKLDVETVLSIKAVYFVVNRYIHYQFTKTIFPGGPTPPDVYHVLRWHNLAV